MNLRAPSPEEVALAEQLVDEAIEPYRNILYPDELALIRDALLDPLLLTVHGRQQLRSALPDPVVGQSGDVATATEQEMKQASPKKKVTRG